MLAERPCKRSLKLNKYAPETTKYVLQTDGDGVKLCRYVDCKIDRRNGALYDGTLSTEPIPPPTPKKPKFTQVTENPNNISSVSNVANQSSSQVN